MEIDIQMTNRVIIGGIIGLFMIFLLFIGIINDIFVKIKKRIKDGPKDEDDKTSLDILIFIYLNIFLTFIHMISLLFRYVNTLNDGYCFTISKICIVLFQLTRTTQYIIFIRRIQVIYSGTIFDLRQKYIYILYSLVAIYAVPYICYLDWTIFFRSTYTDDYGCSMTFHPALFFPQSIFDLFISLCGLYLFIFPLCSLIDHQVDQRDEELQNQIYNILIKYCLLYGTTMASSLILIIVSYIFPYGFYYAIIDGLFNGMMLILLHPEHNTCYKFICCPCRITCIQCCNDYAVYRQKFKSKLEAISSKSNSPSPNNTKPRAEKKRFQVPEIAVFFEIEAGNIVTDIETQTPLDIILTRVNAYRDTTRNQDYGVNLSAISEGAEPLEENHLSNMYKQANRVQNPGFNDESSNENPYKLSPKHIRIPMKSPKPHKVRINSTAADDTPEAGQEYITSAIDKALSLKTLKQLNKVDEARETELADHINMSKMQEQTSCDSKGSAHESVGSGDSATALSVNSIRHLNTNMANSITHSQHHLDVRQNTASISRSMNTFRLITYESNRL